MAGYNLTRTVEEVLEHFEKDGRNLPSFTVHLHPEYWTLNNGSKFLYNNPVASLLDDIRAHRIPVDFLELFDSAKVPFYDGCMIVELLDYRPQKFKEPALEKPERTRVVLHPNSETLWADICLLNQKAGYQWTDQDALEIEARLLVATAAPLCLDPDPHLTRIANNVLRVSTPTAPVSLKRKASVLDPEEHETDKARRAKIMQYMNPRQHRSHAPNYRILDTIQKNKLVAVGHPPFTGPQAPVQIASTVHPSALQNAPPQNAVASSSNEAEPSQKKTNKKKKTDTSQPSHTENENGANPSPTPTPVNGLSNQHMVHLQSNGHHSPSPVSQPPLQANAAGQQPPQPPQGAPHPSKPLRQPSQHPPLQNFQTPPPHFFSRGPPQRNVQPKPNVPTTPGMPQQANGQHVPPQNQMHVYPHRQMQQVAPAQRPVAAQNQNGRATPLGQPSGSAMNPSAATTQRGGSLVTNQGSNSRSPMPNAPHHPNFSMTQNQYGVLHPIPNGPPVPGGPSPIPQSTQDQQGHNPTILQYPIYGYGMNYSRPYAWAMRGPVNGQHMAGMAPNAGHPQPMGKAVPGGMQGR